MSKPPTQPAPSGDNPRAATGIGPPPAPETHPENGPPMTLTEQFGRYHIQRTLGQGGMGSVYLAQDTLLGRPVALKVPHLSDKNPQLLERFYREARVAALLRHPNLCPVYDVGEFEGMHYLAMAYLEGRPLETILRSDGIPPLRQALVLVRKVALALAEMHRHGITHRDVKPANIMIAPDGEPILMDFGLAYRADAEDGRLTQNGQLLGTPSYMAPEQIVGDILAIGPACDVYSLGTLLFELLTGRLPFLGSPPMVLAQVLREAPPPLSEVRADLDPRLEAICQKALAKKPADRFATIEELADALARCLEQGDEVLVTTPSPGARPAASPPCRKQRWLWAGGAGCLAALVVAGAAYHFSWRTPPDGTVRIELEGATGTTEIRIDGAGITGGDQPLPLKAGDHQLVVFGTRIETVTQSFTVPAGGEIVVRVPLRARSSPRPAADEPPGELRALAGHTDVVWCVAASADGLRGLSGSEDRSVRLWDLKTGQEVDVVEGHRGAVNGVAFSSRGKVALSGSDDRTLRLWDLESGRELRKFEGPGKPITSVALSPDGRRALSGGGDHKVWLWDVAAGKALRRLAGHKALVWCVAFSPDGLRALSGDDGGSVLLWDLKGGSKPERLEGHAGAVRGVAFTPDGRRALSCGADATVRLWDLKTHKEVRTYKGHTQAVEGVAVAADGGRVLSGGDDGSVRLWDLESGRELHRFEHGQAVKGVAFAGDRRALSGGADHMVRLWRLPK